ncbi:MAG: flagellar biosynthesis protein FlhA [Desulfovibrionaceae bacterium]
MASSSITSNRFSIASLAKQGDILLAFGIFMILIMMLIPLPTFFLDIMLSFSITLSILILISSMFILSPLEFSIFPTLLLVATLLRLGLNVASTRLILLNGNSGKDAAGSVIASFGEFVVGGNYIVGIVIFLILFILNKIVITAGTSRIAEVAARFTLDAMPGKQMAIEADLNAGIIDEKEALLRRENIRREADFYGAMDGAGKFVQGDVTAGLIITVINLIGGVLIGTITDGMGWQDAISTYTLLTIGDGLVSTIPSIIISTSAGIIVSRAASSAKMGDEFISQLTNNTKALRLVSSILLILAIIPGMPTLPFLLFSVGLFFTARAIDKRRAPQIEKDGAPRQEGDILEHRKKEEDSSGETPESVQALLPLNTLELEVGYGLIPLVDEKQEGTLLPRIRAIRRQLALDMGVIIPSLHLRDNLQLRPGQYCLLIKGNQVATAEVMADHYLAMNVGNHKEELPGAIPTIEPAFKLPALWLPKSMKENASLQGYTIVDPTTVITTHITEVFKSHLAEFLGRQEVQTLLDTLAKRAPKVVEELVPGILSLGTVQKVLQKLVGEHVSIRDLLTIVETLADYGTTIKNPDILTEYVREKLSRNIVKPYLSPDGVLNVFSLDANTEKILQESLRQNESMSYLALPPTTAQKLIQNIKTAFETATQGEGEIVILSSPIIRPHLAKLLTRFLPNIPLLSQAEIPSNIRLQVIGSIGLE